MTPALMLGLLVVPYLVLGAIDRWVPRVKLRVFFLPANTYGAINQVAMGGHAWGPIYLLIRVPLQVFIAAWAYWFTVRLE